MTAPTRRDKEYQRYRVYVEYVQRRCRQPGTRSALRSGLQRTPEQAVRMHAVVANRVPDWVGEEEERAYYTVAALIAGQPRVGRGSTDRNDEDDSPSGETESGSVMTPPRSLGRALAELEIQTRKRQAEHHGGKAGPADQDISGAMSPLERRLHALSRQSVNGVHRQVAPIVLRLRGAEVSVDWAQLLADLTRWRFEQGRITKRWFQDFYRYRSTSTTEQTPSPSEGTES